ncbi:hypothetical protein HDR60_04100 [bacterium]|nr:hypothetical protein [bacterium]
MKLIVDNSKTKKEGDFLIKAFFSSYDKNRPNRIDIIKEVPFTFNDTQVKETAILRFKDNHKKDEIYTSKLIFANLIFDEASYSSGYGTFPREEWDPLPPSKYKNPSLKTLWENPLESGDIRDFMILFNNFHLFIKEDYLVEPEQSFLQFLAETIYKAYKKEKENKKVIQIPNRPQQIYDGLIGEEDIFNKVFSR